MAPDLVDLLQGYLTASNRPLRLRLSYPDGVRDDILMPQRFVGQEAVCDGFSYRVLCVADSVFLPLKDFIGLPAELQIVTDCGELRSLSGIVTQAAAGESDGSLATYQLVLQDVLSIMEKRVNTRVFLSKSELDIIEILVSEWRQRSPVIRSVFNLHIDGALASRGYPKREFTMQHNETDAAFVRRLLKRRGIAWHFVNGNPQEDSSRDERSNGLSHTLVLFDDPLRLRASSADAVRFHRDASTEERDTITAWSAVRTLQPGSVTRHSWDYKSPAGAGFMFTQAASQVEQGESASRLAAALDDYRVGVPHAGDSVTDHASLGASAMAHHDFATKCFNGEGSVRDLAVGEWITVDGHPELDTHDEQGRQFVILSQRIVAQNNLPIEIGSRVQRLFKRSGWDSVGHDDQLFKGDDTVRYRTTFTCVRRGVPIVPRYEPSVDLPRPHLQSALVVGPPNEEVWCDEYGRIKVRFPTTRSEDHEHAHGAGTTNSEGDSAYVRVASHWAGNGPGNMQQCGGDFLPRIGSEVLIDFLGGDPDKPIVVGQLFNSDAAPPALSKRGGLPGNRYQAGIKSREIGGGRSNQLRFDDSRGQISAQLASDHGCSELNLGYLTTPREDGRADPCGEGAELRSDKSVAVRGAQGVLITASATGEAAVQLTRDGLVGVANSAKGVILELSRVAEVHNVDSADAERMERLVGNVSDWDSGTNINPDGSGIGRQPIVATSAEAGLLLASQDSVLVGAEHNIDVASVTDTQISAGHSLFMRAARAMHLFAFKLGIKLIAAGGDIRVESHQGDIVITAAKRIKLVAGEGIDIQSQKICIVAKGAQSDYCDGTITHQSSGHQSLKATEFKFNGPGDANPEALDFPSTSIATDERLVLVDRDTGSPVAGRPYELTLENGLTIAGVTDSEGRTELVMHDALGNVNFKIFPKADST